MSDNIHHTGIIERIDKNKVYVKIVQQSACAGCHAKSMCTASESKDRIIEIESEDPSLRINEEVDVYGKSSLGYVAVLYAFVLPFVLLLTTIIVFTEAKQSEMVSAIAGLAVLPVYYGILYMFRGKLQKRFVFRLKRT